MKITIIGAGPGGLLIAHQLRALGKEVTVYEKRPEEDNGGLGITISTDDMKSLERICKNRFRKHARHFTPAFRTITTSLGEREFQQDKSFDIVGVKRAALVGYLSDIAQDVGTQVEYGEDIDEQRVLAEKDNCDLLIGADGARSTVRSALKMGISDRISKTPFIWLPVEGALTHFVRVIVPYGDELLYMNAYPDSQTSSTAVVEYSGETLDNKLADSERMITQEGIDIFNNLFASRLSSAKFTLYPSKWMNFQGVASRKTHKENVYLIGDAFARIHYRTGAGAIEAMNGAKLLLSCIYNDALSSFDERLRERMGPQIADSMGKMDQLDYMGRAFRESGPNKFFAALQEGHF